MQTFATCRMLEQQVILLGVINLSILLKREIGRVSLLDGCVREFPLQHKKSVFQKLTNKAIFCGTSNLPKSDVTVVGK